MRIGYGYDVHRLEKGRKLVLGGVQIPHETGLDGHSDADVLLHAICDALLGAAALGDIGRHFPDTEEKYREICSLSLLESVAELLFDNGYTVVNIDSTVVAQAPRLSAYTGEMIKNIAEALSVSADRVSVKATTEERLGFTGREEGISAHAVCLIEKQ